MSDFQPLSVCEHKGKYHGSWTVFKDGKRPLIHYDLGEECFFSTNDPFWKRPQDVEFKVHTIAQEMNKELATPEYIKNYFKNLHQNKESNKRKIEQ